MTTKKITVEGVGGVKIGSDAALVRFLNNEKKKSLIDAEGDRVLDFESLEDGGTYTLGPPLQQQSFKEEQAGFTQFEEQRALKHPKQQDAFDVSFTILRNHKQADGLRKLITQAAARNSAFYASNGATTAERHMEAFKSKSVPRDLNISSWSQSMACGDCARLLSVHLHFLSAEKAAAFEGEVIKLLEDRPSAALVNTQDNTVSTNIDSLCGSLPRTMPAESLHPVHDNHYIPRQRNTPEPFDSKDDCDLTVTVTASIPPGIIGSFDEKDPLWPGHAIETRDAVGLYAEKAHIFPHNRCVSIKRKGGKRINMLTNFEWLDSPTDADFNFLYLSPAMHLCFDGSGRGRGAKSQTQAAICIEPLARTINDDTGAKRFKIDKVDHILLATIPLRVWCRSEDVVKQMQSHFVNGKQAGFDESFGLHYFENISVQCVHRLIPMGRETQLMGESQERIYIYNKKVPGLDEQLSGAWSITNEGLLSSTEIMEKCLLWAANQTWNEEWKDTVAPRSFESRAC